MMVMFPLNPVPFGMPVGSAVTVMLDGAVPLVRLSFSQAESLLAVQVRVPPPAFPILSVEDCGVVDPAGNVQPN